MNGHKIMEWNELNMEEGIKKKKEQEEEKGEEKSVEDLENELKKLQQKINASTGIAKRKLAKKIENNSKISEHKSVNLSTNMISLSETEIKKEDERGTQIKKLWEIYKWADNHEKFPWMYFIPDKKSSGDNWKENFEAWKNDWVKFTIDWARVYIFHILDMYEIVKEKPYIFLNEREKAINIIFKNLVDMKRGKNKLAQWIGKDKNKIRIYWRSLDEWANLLYEWAINGGGDIFTLIDLKKAGEEIPGFDTLPDEDIREIINILVRQKKARWIDKQLIRVKILVKGL